MNLMEINHQRRIIRYITEFNRTLKNSSTFFKKKVKENTRQLYSLNALFEIPVFEISQSNGGRRLSHDYVIDIYTCKLNLELIALIQ